MFRFSDVEFYRTFHHQTGRRAKGCDVGNVITAILTLGGDYLMIYVFHQGLRGVAFATSVAIMAGGTTAIIYLLFYARQLRFTVKALHGKTWTEISHSIIYQCRIGSSSLLGELMLAVLAFVGNYVFLHYLGDNGVGAFGITCYYTPFIFMIANAIIQSAQPVISYNYNRQTINRVAEIRHLLLIVVLSAGVFLTSLFLFMPDALVYLFVAYDDAAAPIAISGFPWFAVGIIFFVANVSVIGYFQSLEMMKQALILMMLRSFVLLVPAFLLLPRIIGIAGIWLAMPVSETVTFLFSVYFMAKQNGKCPAITTGHY